jgi:hypothetical protein
VSYGFSSSTGANGNSDSPDISADGRFVAYRSAASDIVPGDGNGVPDLFLYDRQTGVTTLLSADRFGKGSADNRSRPPVFSGNGQVLLFESSAADLVDRSFNFSPNLFAFTPYSSSSIIPFPITISADRLGPWLTWPAVPGRSYHAQFKDTLTDALWQDLNDNISVVGGTAYLEDLTAGPAQRFYRIVAF